MNQSSQHAHLESALKRLSRNKVAMASGFVILIYLLLGVLAKLGLIANDYATINNALSYAEPNARFLFGHDLLGRNVLSRGIHGLYTAISVGFISSCIALPIGITLGAVAGYFGSWIDDVVVWIYTTINSIPYILLLIALSFALGPGLTNIYVAIGMTSWVTLCRLVRAEFFKQKSFEYVLAAESLGASHTRRIVRHILPNIFHMVLIQFCLLFVFAIKMEVILSYLGLGVEPGNPSWGLMIDDAKQELSRGIWWGITCASLMMFGLVLAINLFNDALREALDPKLKNQ